MCTQTGTLTTEIHSRAAMYVPMDNRVRDAGNASKCVTLYCYCAWSPLDHYVIAELLSCLNSQAHYTFVFFLLQN